MAHIRNDGYSPHTPQLRLLSNSLVDYLKNYIGKNKIAHQLLILNWQYYENDKTRNLTLRKDMSMSYCPKGKDTVMSENNPHNWSSDNRQEGRYGRIIKKVLEENCPDFEFFPKDIEELVNMLKGEIAEGEFKVVKGSRITEIYNEDVGDGYVSGESGTLSNSCMQGSDSDFFDIYAYNPTVVSMIILEENNRLIGRALLWTVGRKKYMDRVYGTDTTIQRFIQFAVQNNIIRKERQSYDHKTTWTKPNGENFTKLFKIELDSEHDCFPYVDTFSYFGKGYVTNDSSDSKTMGVMHCTGGDYETFDDYEICHISGERGYCDDMIYLEEYDYSVCQRYAVYDDYRGDYILKTDAIQTVRGSWVHKDNEELVNCYGRGNIWAIKEDDTFTCAIDGRTYLRRTPSRYVPNHDRFKVHNRMNIAGIGYVHIDNMKKAYKKAGYIFSKDEDRWLSPKEQLNIALIMEAKDFAVSLDSATLVISRYDSMKKWEAMEILENLAWTKRVNITTYEEGMKGMGTKQRAIYMERIVQHLESLEDKRNPRTKIDMFYDSYDFGIK